MLLSGSKVIAIAYITTAIFSGIEVLTEVQQRNFINNNKNKVQNKNKTSSYELNILNEFLDYNQLHRAIIIYTSFTTTSKTPTKRWLNYNIEDKFLQLPLIQKLTENYQLQFVNILSPNCSEYLFRSFMHGVGVFMKYKAADKGKEIILNFVSKREKFNRRLKWLLLMEEIKEPFIGIQKELDNLNIQLDADVTVAVKREESIFDLYDVYKICHKCGSPLEVVYKGNWSYKTGFSILNEFQSGIGIRRNNFKMYPVKAITTISNKSPTLNMSDLEYLNNDKVFLDEDAMQRKTYQLLKLMEDLYNFTFDVQFTKSWGAKVNNTWTGTVGALYYNQAEMTVSPLRYAISRITACDYTRNIHKEKVKFVFRHPKYTSIRNIFFEPLDDIVWWCVLVLMFIAILLLAIHVHAEYKIFTMLQKQKPKEANVTAANSIQLPVENHFDFIVLCIIEAILMQGPEPELFRHNSTRILIVSVSIFSILLMQFYGAFIVSSLLSEAPRTITNIEALYNSSLELGIENLAYHYDVFVNNTNPLIQNLYKNRICNKHTQRVNAFNFEEGVKKIGKGNFAFHVTEDRAYRLLQTFLTETQFCELQGIDFHPPVTFTTGIGMRKSTPYYEFITIAIAMIQEASLMAYNNKKWEVDKIDCTSVKSSEVEVDLEHFAPALAFLFLAMPICVLALIIEIIYKKFAVRFHLRRAQSRT